MRGREVLDASSGCLSYNESAPGCVVWREVVKVNKNAFRIHFKMLKRLKWERIVK